jgi:hypothetical protein
MQEGMLTIHVKTPKTKKSLVVPEKSDIKEVIFLLFKKVPLYKAAIVSVQGESCCRV